MRILLATDYYPPFIGGAQIQTQLLARLLRDRGHTVAVATPWQNTVPAREDDAGIRIHRLRQMRTIPALARRRSQHHQPPFPDPLTTLALRRLIRNFEPEIVHSYGWITYSAAAALVGMRTPLLITARDYGYGCANRTLMRDGHDCSGPALTKCLACAGRHYGRPKGWIAALGVLGGRALLRRKVRAVHSISTYVRDMVRRDFFDDRQSSGSRPVLHAVIPSMPAVGAVCDDGETLNVLAQLPREPFMLFVGALRRVKGIAELAAAYELLENPPPLVLLGTREADTPSAFPRGVRVITDAPHRAVFGVARASECLFAVMPSLFPEPFGTVVCEVMSQGKPVIGTQPGGHADVIVEGHSGLLVPRGNIGSLAAAMQRLISDPALRARLGENARIRARQFAPDISLPRFERLYEQVVSEADRSDPVAGEDG